MNKFNLDGVIILAIILVTAIFYLWMFTGLIWNLVTVGLSWTSIFAPLFAFGIIINGLYARLVYRALQRGTDDF